MLKVVNLTCQGKMLTAHGQETCRGNSLIGKMLLRTWPNYCELLQIGAHIKWLVIFLILYSESLGANVLCIWAFVYGQIRARVMGFVLTLCSEIVSFLQVLWFP